MISCPQCNVSNTDEAVYCVQCGTRLDGSTPAGSGGERQVVVDPITYANSQLTKALELIAQGKLSEALHELNEGLRIRPDDQYLLANRADVLSRLGMHSQAENDRNRARGVVIGDPRQHAGFWQRLGAVFLDGIIVIALAVIPAVLFGILAYEAALPDGFATEQERSDAEGIGAAVGYLVYLTIAVVYFWIGNSLGGTWGKRAFGLRVLSPETYKNIGLGKGLARIFVWWLGSIPLYLGWFWMLWDDKKQTWQDKAGGSIVVKHR